MFKNIIITGGAGFIGSHLADKLVENKENNIIVIDNFITSSFENIQELVQKPNFEFIKYDLLNKIKLDEFKELEKFKIRMQGIQEIYHLACPTSPKDYDKFPLETLLANSHATYLLLRLAKNYKAKFLFASSSAIYGRIRDLSKPIKEDYKGQVSTINYRSCYNEGKRFAESMAATYGWKKDLDIKIARIFNTYGPRMKLGDGRMIPDFVKSAIANQEIEIHGDEKSTNTFCYVSDIVQGLIKIMAVDEKEPFNLGNANLYYVKEVAQAIIKITESKSKIKYTEPLPYFEQQGVPDITLARKKLEWLPVVSLEEGLVKTVELMQAGQVMSLQAEKS